MKSKKRIEILAVTFAIVIEFTRVKEALDGGFIITGRDDCSGAIVIKTDREGNVAQ
jgi:hypothetical protein